MSPPLQREEWDFSSLPPNECVAALCWEVLREQGVSLGWLPEIKAWLAGKPSARKPPLPRGSSAEAKKRHKHESSDADKARSRATAMFQGFIPIHEFVFLHKWSLKERRREYSNWNTKHVRPLVENFALPWLCLTQTERDRLCSNQKKLRSAHVVQIDSWFEAISHFEKEKIDKGLPLIYSHSHTYRNDATCASTTLLLRIEWGYTKKRILAAIKEILDKYEPQDIKPYTNRGRKNSDRRAALERLGIMRLLHHYTLAEIRLKIPEAWKLFETRKWYDERRRALRDFRDWSNLAPKEKFFPISWETKATRSRKPA
jgi:hypothetical protein